MKIPFEAVKASSSSYLLEQCLHRNGNRHSVSTITTGSDSGYDSSETNEIQIHEIYAPAPVLLPGSRPILTTSQLATTLRSSLDTLSLAISLA